MRTFDPRKWGFELPAWLNFFLTQTVGRALTALSVSPEEDIKTSRKALANREHRFGRESRITVNAMEMLARQLREDGQVDEAVTLLDEIVRRRTLALGPDNIEVLKSKWWFGVTLTDLKRYAEAEETLEDAVAGLQRALGPENDTTVSASASFARALAYRRDFSRALALQRRVVEVRVNQYGPDYPDSLSARLHLALFLHWADEDTESRLLTEGVLDAKTRLGVDDSATEVARKLLAAIDRTDPQG